MRYYVEWWNDIALEWMTDTSFDKEEDAIAYATDQVERCKCDHRIIPARYIRTWEVGS